MHSDFLTAAGRVHQIVIAQAILKAVTLLKCVGGIDTMCGSPQVPQVKNTQKNCKVNSDCETEGCVCDAGSGNFCFPEKELANR